MELQSASGSWLASPCLSFFQSRKHTVQLWAIPFALIGITVFIYTSGARFPYSATYDVDPSAGVIISNFTFARNTWQSGFGRSRFSSGFGRSRLPHIESPAAPESAHSSGGGNGRRALDCSSLCKELLEDPCLVPPANFETTNFVDWGSDGEQREAQEQSDATGDSGSPGQGGPGILSPQPWHWSSLARECGFQYFSKDSAGGFLRERRILLAGDSQVRKIQQALVRLLSPTLNFTYPKRTHLTFTLPELKLRIDYLFCPYPANLTDLLDELVLGGECPDTLGIGSALWHMLWVNNPLAYEYGLHSVRAAVFRFLSSEGCMARRRAEARQGALGRRDRPFLFWIDFPKLVVQQLNTDRKQQLMTQECQGSYHLATERSGLVASRTNRTLDDSLDLTACLESSSLSPSEVLQELKGGLTIEDLHEPSTPGPLLDLQVLPLSLSCGDQCATDGMHYNDTVYDAAVQLMMNLDSRRSKGEKL